MCIRDSDLHRCKTRQRLTSMSLLDGEHCGLASCRALSFLPIRCAACHTLFCEQHHLPEQHHCVRAAPAAGAATPAPATSTRVPCQKRGCKRFSLQVLPTDGSRAMHQAPRCDRCGALFCMDHRSPAAHGCTAARPPTDGERRAAAAEARRKRAQEVLAKNFGGAPPRRVR